MKQRVLNDYQEVAKKYLALIEEDWLGLCKKLCFYNLHPDIDENGLYRVAQSQMHQTFAKEMGASVVPLLSYSPIKRDLTFLFPLFQKVWHGFAEKVTADLQLIMFTCSASPEVHQVARHYFESISEDDCRLITDHAVNFKPFSKYPTAMVSLVKIIMRLSSGLAARIKAKWMGVIVCQLFSELMGGMDYIHDRKRKYTPDFV